MDSSSHEFEKSHPTLEQYMMVRHRDALPQLKSLTYKNISFNDLSLPIKYVKEVWSSRDFEPYKDFAELQADIRETFHSYYNTDSDSWDFGDAKAHELVAAYLLERGLILGIREQKNIDAEVMESLSDLLNMLYPSRGSLPDAK